MDKGLEGVKKSQNFADVIYGWPLTLVTTGRGRAAEAGMKVLPGAAMGVAITTLSPGAPDGKFCWELRVYQLMVPFSDWVSHN